MGKLAVAYENAVAHILGVKIYLWGFYGLWEIDVTECNIPHHWDFCDNRHSM